MWLRGALIAGVLAIAGMGGVGSAVHADASAAVRVDFSDLDEYGDWVFIPGYGYCWRPYSDSDWRPFSYGHWAWSSDGWLWVSDEPFGWIVCHYGNWFYDDEYGWVWVPGYDWSPARVEWYVTDREIGWAPLLPPPLQNRPRAQVHLHWSFVPGHAFVDIDVRRFITPRQAPPPRQVNVVIHREAPRIEVVQRVVGRPVVKIAPRKVVVTGRPRAITRVEVEAKGPARPAVVVPVGPKFRDATIKRHPGAVVKREVEVTRTPRVEPAPARTNVTVTREVESHPARNVTVTREVESRPAQRQTQTNVTVTREATPNRTVERTTTVEVKTQPGGAKKVKVESRAGGQDDDDEGVTVKKKVTVERQ